MSDQRDLPSDITFDILLRLPVKSLLRFKCICKKWYALIESPSFINRHYGQESIQEHLLIWHCKPIEDYTLGVHLDLILGKYEEPYHLRVPLRTSSVIGHVNGIYCVLSHWWRMALWNPARRQFRPLPYSRVDIQPPLSIFDDSFGFGMDMLSGDYKVVWIRCVWNKERRIQHYPSIVSVYNSGSNSWRHFEDILVDSTISTYRSRFSMYMDGIFYWLTGSYGDYIAILAFDLSSETFREIQVPNYIEAIGGLVAYGDLIALISFEFINKLDVWVMEEEGCWIKKFSLGPFTDIMWQRSLGFWRNSELLLQTRSLDLTLLNVNTKELRNVEAPRKKCENDNSFIKWVNTYKESLFSLKGEGLTCEPFDYSSDLVQDFYREPSFDERYPHL